MRVPVFLFAAARDAIGAERVEIDVADGATAEDVLSTLGEISPEMHQLIPYCRLAVDNRYAPASTRIEPGCELALIPPVSGG